VNDDSANRNFAFIEGLTSHFQSLVHPASMRLKRVCQEFHLRTSPAVKRTGG
jgi:hypothetical protein